MKKLEFEKINDALFDSIDVEKMRRIQGGVTGNSATVNQYGGCKDDGSDCSPCND